MYEEFLHNSNSQCYNENEDCQDAVGEQTAATHQETSGDQESNEVDTSE
jgi:hypothetical protein